MSNFVIVDTETTGLSPKYNEIIDIHAIEVHPEELSIIREAGGRIKPKYPNRMHPLAQQCNGYTQEKWADAESFNSVIMRTWPLIKGNTWVGCNPRFDINFLRNAFMSNVNNTVYLWCINPIDIKDLASHLKKADKIPNLKLDTLCEYYEIDEFEAHTARGDCLRTLEVLRRL